MKSDFEGRESMNTIETEQQTTRQNYYKTSKLTVTNIVSLAIM